MGWYVGGATGAAYGFQLGLAVGTVVSPTQLPGTYGPRLTDNRTTTSQLGAPIVEVFGTDAVAGTVIWLGDIVEHSTTTEVGGKGGAEGEQTTFSYTQPIAIGLARGPMGGILRIWENGKLVYDRRPQLVDESDAAFANRITASDVYEYGATLVDDGASYSLSNGFILYLGDEDQLPDPTIELKEGVGEVPAFRGLMYIVYPDRMLRDDQARRHPNFKFEIFDAGAMSCVEFTQYHGSVLYPWGPLPIDPTNYNNINTFVVYSTGNNTIAGHPELPSSLPGDQGSLGSAVEAASAAMDRSMDEFLGFAFRDETTNTVGYTNDMPGFVGFGARDPLAIYMHYNQFAAAVAVHRTGSGLSDLDDAGGEGGTIIHMDDFFTGSGFSNSSAAVYKYQENETVVNGWDGLIVHSAEPAPVGSFYALATDMVVQVTRFPTAPPNDCATQPLPGYCLIDGYYILQTPWVLNDGEGWRVLRTVLSNSAGDVTAYALEPARPASDPDFSNEDFWTDAYDAAVLAGSMNPGLVYGVDYPDEDTQGYERVSQRCTINTDQVSIANIVRRICNKCGLSDTDIDVSDLETRYVIGYQITRVMDGRSAIAPLRQVGFFDACESGGIVKFPTRGKASVRTLELEDLGAHAYDSEAPPAVTTRKQQDVELPRQLFVQYRDPDRDYETGEQASPTRLITDAVNDSYVDVAVAIGATQAAQCAEVIWADMWAQRWQHAIAVDCSQTELEPTDCILVPVDGRLERMRIVSVDDSAVILRQLSLVRDDDGSYVSVAIADQPAISPSTIIIYSATTLLLLDLPSLRVADNDPGIYAAARRTSSGLTWSGAQIYRSTDGGSTFTAIASVVNEATTGTLDAVFAAGDTTVFDDITEVFVTLISGTLESRTDDDVLSGGNSIAIGAHGRWEILQFGVAEQIDTDQWKLTHLLRGRRGTEHNMATQIAGDTWVLISGAGIIRLPLTNSQIGADILYKAVTFGASFATGTDITFASDGEALVPFSPVSVAGERDSSGDLIITWIRRDRLGSELPGGSDIAMSDPPESYEVDIVTDDSSATVVRTLTSSTQSVIYTAAQEADDFGSSVPDSIIVRIYQMSAVVGRGTAGEATIEDLS